MTAYNFTDYPKYAAFDAAFKEKLIGLLKRNELGPVSAYKLVWAGTEKLLGDGAQLIFHAT